MQVTKHNDSGRREFVIGQLLDIIRSSELKPGAQLPPEPVLSEMFGVSRTVVREAMHSLQATGTIRIEQGRGTFVADNPLAQPFSVWANMNAHRVGELFEVRIILEGESATRAAANRTGDSLAELDRIIACAHRSVEETNWLDALKYDLAFHEAVTQAAGLPLLQEMLGVAMPTWIKITSNVAAEKNRAARLRLVLSEHEAVLEAIRAGSPDAAGSAMRTHLRNSWLRRIANDQQPT